MRGLTLLAFAFMLAGCKLLPQNGYAVDVTIVRAPSLPATTWSQIASLALHVGGAEQDAWPANDVHLADAATFIYPVHAAGGMLTFTIDGSDGNGALVARGAGVVTLRPGRTMFLTVPLAPATASTDLGTVDSAAPDPNVVDLLPADPVDCSAACGHLTSCGSHQAAGDCLAMCDKAPAMLACAAQATTCNDYALCAFTQLAALTCKGNGGIPSGDAGCRDTTMCEGVCNETAPGPACTCKCNSQLDPAQAIDSWVHITCAGAECYQCMPDMFNGAQCDACARNVCGSDACLAH